MKTIELTDEAYANLLDFKNFWSMKLGEITNKEVLDYIEKNSDARGCIKKGLKTKFPTKKFDYEPDFTFSDLLNQWIASTLDEQQTGNVNYIT
jgi:predicted CopG family antitoxin